MPNIPIKSYTHQPKPGVTRGVVHCPWCQTDWPQSAYYSDTFVERNLIRDEWVCPSACKQALRQTQERFVQQELAKRQQQMSANDQGFSQPQAGEVFAMIEEAENVRTSGNRQAYFEALRRIAAALSN